MKIRIGKAEDNDYVVNDPHVSRYHAQLTKYEEGLVIEDLASTNGTFVNGAQILKKRIAMSDRIVLGKDFVLDVNQVLKSNNDYSREFASLKEVYETYISSKVKIQSANTFRTRLFQALPFALPGIIGGIISIAGGSSVFLGVSLFVAVCAPTIGIYMGAKQAAKAPQMLQNLANQFKIDYVCPKCGVFLGEIPWESLENKKRCPACKAKWA
jgi:pSer/pThr/pTyr-binding forkhead associated (FHA) protein/rubredoxin